MLGRKNRLLQIFKTLLLRKKSETDVTSSITDVTYRFSGNKIIRNIYANTLIYFFPLKKSEKNFRIKKISINFSAENGENNKGFFLLKRN